MKYFEIFHINPTHIKTTLLHLNPFLIIICWLICWHP